MLFICRVPNCQRALNHPGPHSAPRPSACEIENCAETTVLRLVSLAAFGDDDRAVTVCGRHFDQWALGIREQAVPAWVIQMIGTTDPSRWRR